MLKKHLLDINQITPYNGNMEAIRILFLTDIHQNIEPVLDMNFSRYQMVLIGGDVVNPSRYNYPQIAKLFEHFPKDSLGVPGNCDRQPEVRRLYRDKIRDIHLTVTESNSIRLGGIGFSRSLYEDIAIYRDYFHTSPERVRDFVNTGKMKFILDFCGISWNNSGIKNFDPEPLIREKKPFFDQFESFAEDEISRYFETLTGIDVLMTHSPAWGVLDQLPGLPHIGSPSIRKGIEKHKPKLVLCGHFHELAGTALENGVLYFNPGAVKDGFYGEIDYSSHQIITRTLRF